MEKRQPIVGQCISCERAEFEGGQTFCRVYRFPNKKWISGNCPMATNIQKARAEARKMLNPLKASKKAKKGK